MAVVVIGQEGVWKVLRTCPQDEDMLSESAPKDHHSLTSSSMESAQQHARESVGRMKHGCSHYRRRCRIRAPCCEKVYGCHHCHNEANSSERLPKNRCLGLPIPKKKCRDLHVPKQKCHDVLSHGVKSVTCSICSTEQEAQQICENCGVKMGEYFCDKCRYFDDVTTKEQYHCDDCGICRTGGRDKTFHCQKCGCCHNKMLQNGHTCVENTMHQNCPICVEYLLYSSKSLIVLRCGHTLHRECFDKMREHSQFFCPICLKSSCDMNDYWERMDQKIAARPMPKSYKNHMVWILCNDCGERGKVLFHFVGHKCGNCKSFNTRLN